MGDAKFMQKDDTSLETTRARFNSVLKRHGELAERLSRDSDRTVFERLQREFEAACYSRTREICLDGEEWNDGLLATIRERVHMEVESRAVQLPGDPRSSPRSPLAEKITYKVGTKMLCCLGGARIGIRYEALFGGYVREYYHCVLESKSFLQKMTVLEHTVPFFLPIQKAENDLLSSNAIKFIDHVGELLQAYVDRREQVRLIQELYGNQLRELYHSLPYDMVEFMLDDCDCKITVGLRYENLLSILPTRASVFAWPVKKSSSAEIMRKGNGISENPDVPMRLIYAEDALRTMSLPEAYAEIVLNLPEELSELKVQRKL
ncbi:hypothetical protein DCAR_0415316 [Daucus carota subsp. sativus]|uniref:Uncharacterized protein n=1 Tax=Daucus carota subsp. sativus TaxID=79200 RepID=A0A165AAD5_DAUCS|nr:PREDICTED: uncharacterized protein LOC108216580 [Daucus carota subsp. sativus]XP_017244863.1 PREDICTED: uncharacterized protein LOC108216580 [Daucus carota subsp. sativus]WOG95986.1 hypothetical protein DCAR_0415316 [Daucus carota subsp. sativus]